MFLVPALADKGAVKPRGRSIEPEIWAWWPAWHFLALDTQWVGLPLWDSALTNANPLPIA